MTNPQKENGYTPIAHELLEAIYMFTYPSASPLKIMLFVARQTYGFKKKVDTISLTKFTDNLCLDRKTIIHWLKWLVEGGLLHKGITSRYGTVYGLNKDYSSWVVEGVSPVEPRPFSGGTRSTRWVEHPPHTIDTNIDTNNKREIFFEDAVIFTGNGKESLSNYSKEYENNNH